MAGAHEGARVARCIVRRQLLSLPTRRFVTTNAGNDAEHLSDLEGASSFATVSPNEETVESFKKFQSQNPKTKKLPGNRYQYHPPKYYRGPLHPVQMPPSSDPTARDFVPGPFSFPRLKHTYDSTIASDLMTMTYKHSPPGTAPPASQKGTLRQWDGSSPYHKNRPARAPRGGGSSRLGLLERDIAWNNIPEIKAVTISAYAPYATENKEYLQVARAVLQAISGKFPDVISIKTDVGQWKIRKGKKAGAKVTITGNAAYDFVDKLITLVVPKIKDWPGVKASTGDSSGNLALGLEPEWMAYFPELEYNYDMYPARLMPGCHIFIQTTGTSDRQGRLLMEALGFPFHGKVTH